MLQVCNYRSKRYYHPRKSATAHTRYQQPTGISSAALKRTVNQEHNAPHNYKVISLKIKKIRNFILRRSAIYLKWDLSTSCFFPILSRVETGRINKKSFASLCTSIIHVNFRTRSAGSEKRRAMSKKHNLINKSRENEKLISRLPFLCFITHCRC